MQYARRSRHRRLRDLKVACALGDTTLAGFARDIGVSDTAIANWARRRITSRKIAMFSEKFVREQFKRAGIKI